MTSSLVGSEMCIRDRPFQELRPQEGRAMDIGLLVDMINMVQYQACHCHCLLYTSDAADDM
eukprot:11263248-Prorocentrum_lima.AAC.1